MEIGKFLKNAVVENDGLFSLEGHSQFNYNDGDKAENYILNTVLQASDISSDSRELEGYIKDWPSLYHFSRNRTLAYRSLNIPPGARILEVGSGCGSITRYLGERAASVLALEGSPRRAAITHARTRDLKSVQVLCASFEDVSFKETFDLVVCNGVLEYASFFVKHDQPHRQMLGALSALLAPGGSLIVAIENQTGLRYFSSGREEHTNIMFDGLEGYPSRPDGARTFGAKTLEKMMSETFGSVEMLLPLPDYKLPVAVIRADLLELVNCSELFANAERHDFGSHVLPKMHERLVWGEMHKNGLMRDFANSFFMIAGDKKTALLGPGWMGDIYSIRRKPEWAMRTRISAGADGVVSTAKSYLEPDAERGGTPFVHHAVKGGWANGTSIHTAVVRALLRKSKMPLEERLHEPVLAWWAGIKKVSPAPGALSGAVLDHNWQNAIMVEGEVEFIDGEWAWSEDIDPAWLLYRVVAKFANDEISYVHRWSRSCRTGSIYRMMKVMAKNAGIEVSLRLLFLAIKHECEFQEAVTARKASLVKSIAQAMEPIVIRQRRRMIASFLDTLRLKVFILLGKIQQRKKGRE